jgi:hypothetical protein
VQFERFWEHDTLDFTEAGIEEPCLAFATRSQHRGTRFPLELHAEAAFERFRWPAYSDTQGAYPLNLETQFLQPAAGAIYLLSLRSKLPDVLCPRYRTPIEKAQSTDGLHGYIRNYPLRGVIYHGSGHRIFGGRRCTENGSISYSIFGWHKMIPFFRLLRLSAPSRAAFGSQNEVSNRKTIDASA